MLIKFINCTEKYHDSMDRIVNFLSDYFNSKGISNYSLKIGDMKIARCTQCRCCTLKKGETPIKCVTKDEMNDALEEIENADAFVILADINLLFSKNKVHEIFSERLVAYYYWPFTQDKATPRKLSLDKNSILISYNTTKYFMNHTFHTSKQYMEHTSTAIGAKVLDWQALTPKKDLLAFYKDRLIQMADKLIGSLELNNIKQN